MKAFIYCRYSSDNQNFLSIEAQNRAIEEFCIKEDIQIIKKYYDEAQSARTDNRTNFLLMFDEMLIYKPDYVIVHKLDRFARNRYDSAFYRKKLENNGTKLISVLEPNEDTPENLILTGILETMAEYYSKNLAREVKKGMKETALQCKHNGGTAPTGYDVAKDKTYIINENESEIVRNIFKLYLENFGYIGISKELNALGFKTKKGVPFGKNSIRKILTNEKYTGLFIFAKGKENEIKIENGIPQIIDQETFQKVQHKLSLHKPKPRVNQKNYFMLTGYIKCGECGGAFVGNSTAAGRNNKRYNIYTCSTKINKKTCKNKDIRQELIESYVIEELQNKVFSDNAINEIAEKMIKYTKIEMSGQIEEKSRLEEAKKQTQIKIDKLFDLYLDGDIEKSAISEKINTLKNDLNGISERLFKLDVSFVGKIDKNAFVAFLKLSRDTLKDNDTKIKRKIIETFVEKIIVFDKKVEVYFNITDKVGGGEGLHRLSVKIKGSISKKDLFNILKKSA